jgi:nucleotide-binding universal stress UspA family protein
MSHFELGNDGPTVVLTGVDGSRTSMRAAAYAAGLARRQGALLVGVYVLSAGAMGGLTALSPGSVAAVAQSSHQLADQLRDEAVKATAELGIRFRFITAEGDPYHELTRIADEVRAEVVVIGASEAAGHRLVGSLAVRLVRAGRWPVTVVP